ARQGSLYHRWAAIACVAVWFGAMHWPTPQQVPALIILGVFLGYLYERTGSILAPIYLHILFNSKSVLWHYLGG
ncbi:MAG: CPBP family intramembrane glutamic endopeptidase, partial [Phycisphaerales bacterium]